MHTTEKLATFSVRAWLQEHLFRRSIRVLQAAVHRHRGRESPFSFSRCAHHLQFVSLPIGTSMMPSLVETDPTSSPSNVLCSRRKAVMQPPCNAHVARCLAVRGRRNTSAAPVGQNIARANLLRPVRNSHFRLSPRCENPFETSAPSEREENHTGNKTNRSLASLPSGRTTCTSLKEA